MAQHTEGFIHSREATKWMKIDEFRKIRSKACDNAMHRNTVLRIASATSLKIYEWIFSIFHFRLSHRKKKKLTKIPLTFAGAVQSSQKSLIHKSWETVGPQREYDSM